MQVYLNNTDSINEIIGKLPAGLTSVYIGKCGNAALLQEFLNKLPLSVAHVNLRINNLGQLGAAGLKKALSVLPTSVTEVNLRYNDLNRLGAAGLKKALSGLPEGVTHVDLCGNDLNFLGAEGLKTALSGLPTRVTEVNLNFNYLSFLGAEGLKTALSGLSEGVAHVNLRNNCLNRLGAAGLSAALSGLPTSVTEVNLRYNRLGQLGAAGLKTALSGLPTSVTEVNLSYNQLSSVIKEFNGSSSSTKDNIALANIQELTLSISDVDNSDKKCLNYFLSKLFPGLLKLKLIDEDDREVRSVIHEEFLEDFFADRQKLLMDPVHKHINVTDLASIVFGYACGPTLSEEIKNNSYSQQSHCGPTLSTDSVKLSDNPSSDRQQSHSRYKFFAVLTLSLFVILTSSVFAGLAVLGRNVGEFFKHFTLDLSHKIMLVLLLTAGASLIASICFVGGARAESKAANSNSGLTPQYRPYN